MTDDGMTDVGLQDYLDAMRLAVEAAATPQTAMAVIGLILDAAPEGDPKATMPTRILIDAIRAADGDLVVAAASLLDAEALSR